MNNEITIDQPIKTQNVIAQRGKDDCTPLVFLYDEKNDKTKNHL